MNTFDFDDLLTPVVELEWNLEEINLLGNWNPLLDWLSCSVDVFFCTGY